MRRSVLMAALSLTVVLGGCFDETTAQSTAAQKQNQQNSHADDQNLNNQTADRTSDNGQALDDTSLESPVVNQSRVMEPVSCHNEDIIAAFENKQSDVQVKGCGTVIKVLADDNKGSRHQKFLLALNGVIPEHTLLVAHNIDLAPRVPDLKQGSELMFYGEYEYNTQGGVIHWTHHDPASRHQDGWIQSQGERYQ